MRGCCVVESAPKDHIFPALTLPSHPLKWNCNNWRRTQSWPPWGTSKTCCKDRCSWRRWIRTSIESTGRRRPWRLNSSQPCKANWTALRKVSSIWSDQCMRSGTSMSSMYFAFLCWLLVTSSHFSLQTQGCRPATVHGAPDLQCSG